MTRFQRFLDMSGADSQSVWDALHEASLVSTLIGRCLVDPDRTADLQWDLNPSEGSAKAVQFQDVLLLPYE